MDIHFQTGDRNQETLNMPAATAKIYFARAKLTLRRLLTEEVLRASI